MCCCLESQEKSILTEELTPLQIQIADLTDEIARLSAHIKAAFSESDNPSAKCEKVLSETPKCYDFRAIRRYTACRAWNVMEIEKAGWAEAIKAGWAKARETCTWT